MSDQYEYGYDDRKTLLDVYYDGGGKVGEELSLRGDIYEGLIALANHAAAEARAEALSDAEFAVEQIKHHHRASDFGSGWWKSMVDDATAAIRALRPARTEGAAQ